MSDKIEGLAAAVGRIVLDVGRDAKWRRKYWGQELPIIVCLCGSTRFHRMFEKANLTLTLAGCIVLSIGANAHDDELGITAQQKAALDELHLRKIDLADCVLVLNVGGYIGASRAGEIAYARKVGKPIVFLEEIPQDAA